MRNTIRPSNGRGRLIAAAYSVDPNIGPNAFPNTVMNKNTNIIGEDIRYGYIADRNSSG